MCGCNWIWAIDFWKGTEDLKNGNWGTHSLATPNLDQQKFLNSAEKQNMFQVSPLEKIDVALKLFLPDVVPDSVKAHANL